MPLMEGCVSELELGAGPERGFGVWPEKRAVAGAGATPPFYTDTSVTHLQTDRLFSIYM
jgi:hypothetical protein